MSASTAAASFREDPRQPHGPEGERHIVQFYEDEAFLVSTVGDFIASGLRAREPVVVIATESHRAAFTRHLGEAGFDPSGLVAQGWLTILDASETLAKFIVDDDPDPALFRRVVGAVLRTVAKTSETGRFRAYGEMVDLLWRAGKPQAAIRLEEIWNDAGRDGSFSLLCTYQMQNFEGSGDVSGFGEVCRMHSRVIPTEKYLSLRDSDTRLREISILQQRARALESEIARRERVETSLREALKVRDDFLCVAGHELRTPLTVLRLQLASLLSNDQLTQTPRTERRLATLASQTERLARLAERLVDVSQLGEDVILRPKPVDLSELVRESVEAAVDLAETAGCQVTLLASDNVVGCWDRDRLEQVMQDLLANAFKFGRGAPVQVSVKGLPHMAEIVVRDGGIGIASDDQGRVFDRFQRAAPTERFDGLGLGLWIVRRIVEAHGGDIRVESSPGKGAAFILRLPYSMPA